MTDDKTRELLPCPFCDGEARLREGMGEYWVGCIACSATSCMRLSRGAAAREWNTRQAAKELYAHRESEGSIILKYLKGKLDSHCEDFAYNEIDTNAVVFSTRESEDYANNLEEIIDEIEELIATKAMDIGESE